MEANIERVEREYSPLECLDKPPLVNVLFHLSESDRLTLRLLSRQMKSGVDAVLQNQIMLCVILWRFVDETIPQFHVLRIPNQPFARNFNRRDFQPLKNILELCHQKLQYREFLWHGFTTGWRAQRVTKTGLKMMIDAIALNQDYKLTFGQTSQLRHLLKEVASQLYFCTKPVNFIQQVPGFSTLQKVCDRLSKGALIPLPFIGIIYGILLLTGVGSAIIPLLFAGMLITLLVGAMALTVPILVSEGHKCIVAHRALTLRTGFVNNLHRQFEELKANVLSSVAREQLEVADHADEAMPLLALDGH